MPPLSKTDPDVVEDIEDLDVDDLDGKWLSRYQKLHRVHVD